jgi:putative transposase
LIYSPASVLSIGEAIKIMARANRHYIPGLVWHITQRCHKREFLLKCSKDKRAWLHWMLAAKRLYGLCVLNFIITSNHIHLLISDQGNARNNGDSHISRSLQLAEARVAQDYNRRKDRSGAFWEDRYHATAVETGEHFVNCLTYIDLNMVRADVVNHPGEWPFGGYYELQETRQRFRNQLVDWRTLLSLLGMRDLQQLREARTKWVDEECRSGRLERDPKWTESVAVGGKQYVERIVKKLGGKAIGIDVQQDGETYTLREAGGAYLRVFEGKNKHLRSKIGPK